jgi:hypothetical protein
MAFDVINIGATANDGTGDPLRTAFDKTNDNFALAVEGPTGAVTADTVALFDGTTGKLIKGGGQVNADIVVTSDARLSDARTPLAHGNEAHTSTFVDAAGAAAAAPVQSVNTQTGVVVLDTDDVGEGTVNLYNRVPAAGTVGQSLVKVSGDDYDTGWESLTAADVGAVPNNILKTVSFAETWRPVAGTAALLGSGSGANYRTFLDASNTFVRASVEIPFGATEVDIELLWAGITSAATGDVVWQTGWHHPIIVGSSLVRAGNQDSATGVTATAGAQNIVVSTTLVSNFAIASGARMMTQSVARFGNAEADTYNGTAAAIALIYAWKA